MICIKPEYHFQDLKVDGVPFKSASNTARDVDHLACMSLLLRFNANPRLSSAAGALAIFEVIKQGTNHLSAFLENDQWKSETVNQLNRNGRSPLCVLASMRESQETIEMIKTLLTNGASLTAALPSWHPLDIARAANNKQTIKAIKRHG